MSSTCSNDSWTMIDEEVTVGGPNTVEELGKGIIGTHKGKTELTILVVGETGTGKTTFLSLLANVLGGNSPSTYVIFNDIKNEAGGSKKHSQTNETLLYTFASKNGVKFHILDTPGLADTRGIGHDERHKENIAQAISDSVTDIDAVLILINGTVPRLGVATDHVLSMLLSMFPVTLAENIGFVFTNISSPLSWNFDEDSLPEVLSGNQSFFLDNSVALWARYLREKERMEVNSRITQRRLKTYRRTVEESHKKALGEFVKIFDWLDTLTPQLSADILSLHGRSKGIDMKVSDILATMGQMDAINKGHQDIEREREHATLTIERYKNYESSIVHKIYKQVGTVNHNTLCTQPGCYSNCDENCTLGFSFDPQGLLACWVFSGSEVPPPGVKCHPYNLFTNPTILAFPWFFRTGLDGLYPCAKCGHPCNQHRHYNSRWELHDDVQHTTDVLAKRKYDDATSQKVQCELGIEQLKRATMTLDTTLTGAMNDVGKLLADYSTLSLSGSFAVPTRKTVSLMGLALEATRGNGADVSEINSAEIALSRIQQKLAIIEKAEVRCDGRFSVASSGACKGQ